MGWLIALGVVILLALLPIGIRGKYSADGVLAVAILGPVRLTLYPRKPKEEKNQASPSAVTETGKKPDNTQKSQQKKIPSPPKHPDAPADKEKGGSLLDFLPLVKVGLSMLNTFRKKITVPYLECRITLAGGDPCDLGMNYGRTWAAGGNLMPQLERFLTIKKRNIQVDCDFTTDKTRIFVDAEVTITLGRLLSMGVVYGLRMLKTYLSIQKKRKGGADK